MNVMNSLMTPVKKLKERISLPRENLVKLNRLDKGVNVPTSLPSKNAVAGPLLLNTIDAM